MERTLTKDIRIKSGTEGPRQDPYSYTEYHVRGVVLHLGLAEWIRVQGHDRLPEHGVTPLECFERLTGFTPDLLEKAYRKSISRCRKCGCKRLESQSGFPGEELIVCSRCGEIITTEFHESEII